MAKTTEALITIDFMIQDRMDDHTRFERTFTVPLGDEFEASDVMAAGIRLVDQFKADARSLADMVETEVCRRARS